MIHSFFSQYYLLSESEGFKIICPYFSISWTLKNQACADTTCGLKAIDSQLQTVDDT